MVELVLESWASLSSEVIKKSFKVCGLNLAVDGSEDPLIHCFKEGRNYTDVERTASCGTESSLNVKPFTDSDVEDGTENFMLVDESDDDDKFIDI